MNYSDIDNDKHRHQMGVLAAALGFSSKQFKPEEWLKEGTFKRVLTILDKEFRFAPSTARNYLISVCYVLSQTNNNDTVYHAEVRERGKKLVKDDVASVYNVSLKQLEGVRDNVLKPVSIRAICALLLAGVTEKIGFFKGKTVQDALNLLNDDQEDTARFISDLFYNNHGRPFLLDVKKNETTPAVFSTMFKRMTGAPFKEFVSLVKNKPSAVPAIVATTNRSSTATTTKSSTAATTATKTKPAVKAKPTTTTTAESTKEKPSPTVKPKVATKPKPSIKARSPIDSSATPAPKSAKTRVPWNDTIPDGNVKQQTKDLHIRQVRKLQENALKVSGEAGFDWKAFNNLSAYYTVMAYLESPTANKGKPFSNHTKRSYLSSLCKLLSAVDSFNASLFSRYSRSEEEYQHAIDATNDETNADGRGTVDFEAYIPKLRSIVANTKIISYVRVLCAWIISDLNENNEPDNLNGVLRPSDLMETRFIDDGKHNFLDMENKRWFIRAANTKNGVARTLQVDRFCSYLDEIYGPHKPEYLLVNRKGRKMEHSYASANFKDVVGVPYTQFRKGYYDFRNKRGIRQAQLTVLSKNMGHAPKTAITVYQQVPN